MRGGVIGILMVVGLVLGAAYGHLLLFSSVTPLADDHWTLRAAELVLVRPMMMLAVPLVLLSLVLGAARIADAARLGLVVGLAIVLFLVTTLLASSLGVAAATALQPGRLDPAVAAALRTEAPTRFAAGGAIAAQIDRAAAGDQASQARSWTRFVRPIVPENLLVDLASARIASVILFAILLGLALALGGARAESAVRVVEGLFDAIVRIVRWLTWMAPAGVFFLAAWTSGRIGLDELRGPLAAYLAVVVGGLLVHGLIVLPVLLAVLGRANPFRFLWQTRVALLTALGTASSAAALPVGLDVGMRHGRCSLRSAAIVLPLGAAANMNGTALFQAAATVFLFQLFGIDLDLPEFLIVVITAMLAAIGTAGLPSAGLVTITAVIAATNTSLAGRNVAELPVAAIGLIIAVDRLLDMCRTAVNVWGDLVCARIITILAPDEPAPGAGAS